MLKYPFFVLLIVSAYVSSVSAYTATEAIEQFTKLIEDKKFSRGVRERAAFANIKLMLSSKVSADDLKLIYKNAKKSETFGFYEPSDGERYKNQPVEHFVLNSLSATGRYLASLYGRSKANNNGESDLFIAYFARFIHKSIQQADSKWHGDSLSFHQAKATQTLLRALQIDKEITHVLDKELQQSASQNVFNYMLYDLELKDSFVTNSDGFLGKGNYYKKSNISLNINRYNSFAEFKDDQNQDSSSRKFIEIAQGSSKGKERESAKVRGTSKSLNNSQPSKFNPHEKVTKAANKAAVDMGTSGLIGKSIVSSSKEESRNKLRKKLRERKQAQKKELGKSPAQKQGTARVVQKAAAEGDNVLARKSFAPVGKEKARKPKFEKPKVKNVLPKKEFGKTPTQKQETSKVAKKAATKGDSVLARKSVAPGGKEKARKPKFEKPKVKNVLPKKEFGKTPSQKQDVQLKSRRTPALEKNNKSMNDNTHSLKTPSDKIASNERKSRAPAGSASEANKSQNDRSDKTKPTIKSSPSNEAKIFPTKDPATLTKEEKRERRAKRRKKRLVKIHDERLKKGVPTRNLIGAGFKGDKQYVRTPNLLSTSLIDMLVTDDWNEEKIAGLLGNLHANKSITGSQYSQKMTELSLAKMDYDKLEETLADDSTKAKEAIEKAKNNQHPRKRVKSVIEQLMKSAKITEHRKHFLLLGLEELFGETAGEKKSLDDHEKEEKPIKISGAKNLGYGINMENINVLRGRLKKHKKVNDDSVINSRGKFDHSAASSLSSSVILSGTQVDYRSMLSKRQPGNRSFADKTKGSGSSKVKQIDFRSMLNKRKTDKHSRVGKPKNSDGSLKGGDRAVVSQGETKVPIQQTDFRAVLRNKKSAVRQGGNSELTDKGGAESPAGANEKLKNFRNGLKKTDRNSLGKHPSGSLHASVKW